MDIAEEFDTLYKRWYAETMFSSNPRVMYENENFQKIIKLGMPVLPYIVNKIHERGADFTYMAIPEITKIPHEEVIPESMYGYIGKICNAWVAELKKRNLI